MHVVCEPDKRIWYTFGQADECSRFNDEERLGEDHRAQIQSSLPFRVYVFELHSNNYELLSIYCVVSFRAAIAIIRACMYQKML